MAKRTIKINLKLPTGVTATKELEAKATQAAKDAIASSVQELAEAQQLAKELSKKGIQISATELLSRKSSKPKSAPRQTGTKTTRKRVVLSAAQKTSLISDLEAGAKVAETAEKFGISTATVMNLKTAAGLTKKRK